MTEWRRIQQPPYRDYEVSDDGRIRRNGRELKGCIDRYGYRNVLLSYAGLSQRFKVHRLVCEAYHGPCPEGMECAHLDGSPINNAADNLAWVTRSENTKHQMAHGTFKAPIKFGEDHPQHKLTAAQVLEMRARHAAGESGRSLARAYGIARGTAHRILTGKKWPQGCAQDPTGAA